MERNKLLAMANIGYDIVEGDTGGCGWTTRSSKAYPKKVSNRKLRHTLKAELRKEFVSGEIDDVIWAEEQSRAFAEKVRKLSGFGAGAVTIIRGKVVVL